MAMNAEARPRCSICDLPHEIKAKIVLMCDEQDRRFRDTCDRIIRRGEDEQGFGFSGATVCDSVQQEGDARSCIISLSLVSKVWNALAEPYRFTSLTASQLLALPFRLGLDQRYGHCVKSLDLRGLSALDVVTVISAFGRLPNVRHVVVPETPLVRNKLRAMLSYDAARLSDSRPSKAPAEAAMDALWAFLTRMPSIAARDENIVFSTVKELANRDNALVDLKIHLSNDFDKAELLKILVALPKLRHLDMTTGADLAWDAPATLVNLEIEFIHAEHWGGNFLLDRGTRFAKLERIRLAGDGEACSGVLASIRSDAFPALRDIEVDVRRENAFPHELAY